MGGRRARGAAAPAPVPPDGVGAAVRGRACACGRRSGAASRAPAAATRGCVIAALFVPLPHAAERSGRRARRRRARRDAGGDTPAKLLALAVTRAARAPPRLGTSDVRRARHGPRRSRRWRFSLGCARAAGVIRARVTLSSHERGWHRPSRRNRRRARGDRGARRLRVVRYPGLRSKQTLRSSQSPCRPCSSPMVRSRSRSRAGRRLGDHRPAPRPDRRRPDRRRLAGRPLADPCVEGMGSRPPDRRAARSRLHCRTAAQAGGVVTAGTRAALWSGIVGGLLVFTSG